MTKTITRGMASSSPHDLQALIYPLYAGVKKYARDNDIDTNDGEFTLTLTWTEKK